MPVFRRVRDLIETGGIGRLQAIIACCGSGGALWTHTHTADMLLFLAGDAQVAFVQGMLATQERDWDGERLTLDPSLRMGFVGFASGAHGYIVSAPGDEYEVRGSDGAVRILNGGIDIEWRRAREPWRLLQSEPLPEAPQGSGTVAGLLELVAALDGESEPSGAARVARAGLELLFAMVESHRQEGRRVPLPLVNRRLTIRPDGW
jgi:predicted dehydrogenase